MSERSGPPSDEGSGDDIRPYGDDRDSSEESSEEDPEEARKIADGFIVDEDDEEGGGEASGRPDREEDPEERRRRRKEKKRKRRREREERARQRERDNELSEDELELLNENRGLAGPSRKPLKRLRRRSGSEEEGPGANLKDMFADDAERGFGDEDEDDLGDFIEEDDEEEGDRGETEEQRRARKREEKLKRREAGKLRPDVSGVDRQSMDEIYAVFGNEDEYAWALDLEGTDAFQEEEREKKDIRLEDVFDPSEIKERRLQDEDKTIVSVDRPERHQLVNSTLSENPVFTPDSLYPPPELAARWAFNKISPRTRYLFCGLDEENSYIPPGHDYTQPVYRRMDLMNPYIEAVSAALNMMFVQHLEVPYLWHYKRDVFSILENQGRSAVQFLERDDLWSLYHLGIKYRAIFGRLEQMRESWTKIKERHEGLTNEYLTETLLPNVCAMSVEAAADGYEWLNYHYASDMGWIKQFEAIDEGVKRLPEKALADDLRTGPILKLVEAFGVSVPKIARYFSDPDGQPATVVNPDKPPLELADEFSGPNTPFLHPEDALAAAARILTTDFAKDPSLRQQARDWMSELGQVSVTPTERGMTVIDKYHFYYTFKFLTDKPIGMFRESPQFLHILKAEEEGLVEITIKVDDRTAEEGFISPLTSCCRSNDYGELSTAWNDQRRKICEDVVKKHLIPSTARWAKDYLRGQAEDYVAERCRMELEFRVNVRPFATPTMEQGETPSVLALTNGKGEGRDAVVAVLLDEEGNIRTQSKFDNLRPGVDCDSFKELVRGRNPKVIVVGGLSVNAGKMREEAATALRELAIEISKEQPPASDAYPDPDFFRQALAEFDMRMQEYVPPLIFVSDATARMYMHSEEAEREYPSLPPNGRYALALARYTQNPLNAYCKLGRKISEITFMEHHQKLISQEKLLVHLERGLVNAVCFMGIEINSCVADAYQRTMLPFIAGLGPRKANALVNGVLRLGALTNRMQFSDTVLVGPTIFENLAGFLSIEHDLKDLMLEEANPQEQPDPLDMTRIHPEDYEFAQKMCQDAMDLDVEDVEGQHKSDVVLKLMLDEDRTRKLAELNLEDFAYNLQQQGEGSKRHTLSQIVSELISYRADRRPAFYVPNEWEIVTMLTGETERTIGRGMGVTATVRRALASRAFCSLESGIDAVLEREYVLDDTMPPINSCEDVLKARQSVKAIVLEAQPARFQVKISMRPSDVSQAVIFQQPFREDPYNDMQRQMDAEEAAAHRRRRQAGAVKRQINHPNWHAVNSGQAQQYLHSGQRGDVVIRPSSKGGDHLAVTWKVDEDIYQHIDVQEIDKPNEYALGRILRVAGKYSYSDLDELIINHVKALARMVEMLMASEKYKPEEELDQFLKNYVQAHPGRSMYGFTLDTDRPGHFQLRFLNRSTKDGGVIRTWPVKVLPGAYQLNEAIVGGVMELSNAFKMQYSNMLSEQGSGGKTPGVRVGKTPLGNRTPGGGRTPGFQGAVGGRTPADPRMAAAAYGRTPVRPGMTPNPYNAPAPQAAYAGAGPYGGAPNMGGAYGQPGPGPNGAGAYSGPPPPNGAGGYGMPPGGPGGSGAAGMGMNPERAAMIARQGGR